MEALPVTPVGKIFKPELARKEIADVIRKEAFESKVVLESLDVVPDQTLGNVAKIKVDGDDSKLRELLDAYTFHVLYGKSVGFFGSWAGGAKKNSKMLMAVKMRAPALPMSRA